DGDRISAIYSRGVWRYQKFHDIGHVRELAERFIGGRHEVKDAEGRTLRSGPIRTTGWSALAINERPAPVAEIEAGLRFEFDLPLPGDRRYGRADEVIETAAWLREEREE